MPVIILHPTEELKLIKLQKELISELFEDGRILYAARPLWIKINTEVVGPQIKHIELGELEVSDNSIYIPVTITTEQGTQFSKLTLVIIHNNHTFTDTDRQNIEKIKQPVRQLKVFRLGIEKELSSNSKCITESKWIQIR